MSCVASSGSTTSCDAAADDTGRLRDFAVDVSTAADVVDDAVTVDVSVTVDVDESTDVGDAQSAFRKCE